MDTKNVKVLAVTVVVVAAALLFSWQYTGQDDDGEGMLGDWTEVATINMHTFISVARDNADTQSGVSVGMSDGLIVYESDDGKYRFRATSDCEAVSVDDGAARQLYLENGVLYMLWFSEVSDKGAADMVLTMTVLTRDGSFEFAVEDIPQRTFSASARAFDPSGAQSTIEISAEVESKLFCGLHMTLTIDGVKKSAVAFSKYDGDRLVIFGAVPDSMIFSIVYDGSSAAITGIETSSEGMRYTVADADGLLADDVLGIGSKSGLTVYGTGETLDFRYRYDGGFMYMESSKFSGYYGVYAPGLHGEGTFQLSAGTVLLVDDRLELVTSLS